MERISNLPKGYDELDERRGARQNMSKMVVSRSV